MYNIRSMYVQMYITYIRISECYLYQNCTKIKAAVRNIIFPRSPYIILQSYESFDFRNMYSLVNHNLIPFIKHAPARNKVLVQLWWREVGFYRSLISSIFMKHYFCDCYTEFCNF